jgi:acetolactate synthase I/II/III large subunit
VRKSGAEILVDALIREGVEVLFGFPGGVVIPIFDALYKSRKPRVILVRHEQAAAHAADGYARATGRVGVCLATSGPGATNLMTGIATAYLDSVPMVAITGQVSRALLGTDAFQEADVVGMSRPITKHNILVQSIEEFPSLLREAFHIAATGRPGPVLIDIPVDISRAFLDNYEYPSEVRLRGYRPNVVGHIRQIKRAAEMIKQAQKPLIFAGGGIIISGAHEELRTLAEKISAPVTMSLMGLGGFPASHPLYIGMPGMHGSKAANMALQQADLILSIGVRFDDRVTGDVTRFAPQAKIVHMDIDPAAIAKNVKVDVPVVGDAKNILTQLNPVVEMRAANGWNRTVMEWKGDRMFPYEDSDTEVKPQRVIEELYRLTEGKAIVATEVGQNQMWAAHHYKFDRPRRLLTSGGLGTMGYGMPAAMGAALACPGEVVVDIAGDGSIQMNIQELATISLNHIPVKVVILNNGYLGMVRQWQELFYDKRYSSTCLREQGELCDDCKGIEQCAKAYVPDFVALAAAYGIKAFRTSKPSEVVETLKAGLAVKGPAIMEFMVSPEENVFPMVPAGKPIDEILEAP